MTGILAIWHMDGTPVPREPVAKMAEPMAYRGPHGMEIILKGEAALAQSRLSVTAQDPSQSLPFQEDGLILAADARLDDRQTLAATLSQSSDTSDAALLAAAWRRWGRDCAAHLTGDFAFVLWDELNKTLFAARDCMGVRPLYYAKAGPTLCLASEAQQIAAHPQVSDALSQEALWMWTMGQYDVTLPLYREVKGLPAGSCLMGENGEITTRTYWNFSQIKTLEYANHEDYFQHFRELFGACVKDRLRTRAPVVGTMLSGGMDSTSVTAMARRQTQKQLLPFSFQFKTLPDCDESAYSQAVADKSKLKINWVDCEQFWLLKGAYTNQTQREDPFQCWDQMDHWILERLAQNGVNVLLTGHGGDSLMTGLGTLPLLAADFRRGDWRAMGAMIHHLKSSGNSIPGGLASVLIAPSLPCGPRYHLKRILGKNKPMPSWIPKHHHRAYQAMERRTVTWPTVFREWDRQQAWELITPVSTGVRRAMHWYQRLAAPYGIEVRHPLYDRRLAEFMLAIPQKMVRYEGWLKGFLRRAMAEILPSEVTWRKDKPTLAAYYHYGVTKESKSIFNAIENSMLAKMGMIDKDSLAQAVRDYLQGDPTRVVADFLPVLTTDLWLKARKS